MANQPEDPADSFGGGAPDGSSDGRSEGVLTGVPGVLAQLRAQVRDLAGTLWAARGRDELMDTVVGIETLKSSLEALGLDVVRELDVTGAVKPCG